MSFLPSVLQLSYHHHHHHPHLSQCHLMRPLHCSTGQWSTLSLLPHLDNLSAPVLHPSLTCFNTFLLTECLFSSHTFCTDSIQTPHNVFYLLAIKIQQYNIINFITVSGSHSFFILMLVTSLWQGLSRGQCHNNAMTFLSLETLFYPCWGAACWGHILGAPSHTLLQRPSMQP